MSALSPAAQAVLDAAMHYIYGVNRGSVPLPQTGILRSDLSKFCAAALRAAVDQVVPDGPKPSANSDFHLMNWTKSLDQYYQRQQTRAELLAIAAELGGGTTTPDES